MKTLFLCLLLSAAKIISAQTTVLIHFASDASILDATAQKILDSLAANDAKATVAIKGFCDSTGSEAHNRMLSMERADAVRNYLAAKHIKVTHSEGFAALQPLADNRSEKGKALNRRVEIIVTNSLAVKPGTNSPAPVQKADTSGTLSKENLEVGKKLVLKNLNFIGGTPVLLPESEPTLKDLLRLMKENPGLEIRIEGHVCCADDMELSLERAIAVLNYLAKNGIRRERLSYVGLSNHHPIAAEDSEEGRTKNRRVEITIIKL